LLGKLFHRPFFIRLLHWEYWPFGAVYIWTLPAWIWFSLRSRSLFFFTASNPSITNGGMLGESKKEVNRILPSDLCPLTLHVDLGTDPVLVLKTIKDQGMSFPLIGKPDIGGKGRGVKILRHEPDVVEYAAGALMDFHIQQYVAYDNEVGIFYHRFPGESRGKLTGIVSKQFLSVTGNGRDDLRSLLHKDKRGIMYIKGLEQINRDDLDRILAKGETRVVAPFGNHARGSLFLDHSHLIDDRLTDIVDGFSRRIPGFYFGRFDIRYASMEALKQGRDFRIIELNGAGAEPTHMYDPRHSLFFALKEIIRHWNILAKISRMNHYRGVPYPTFREGIRIFSKEREDSAKLARMSG
jgi:hypothetical protein